MPMSSSSTIAAKILKLEKELNQLKVSLKKNVKKPKYIDECETKEQLELFTLDELKNWLKKNEINVKKITEKHKSDFVEIVWENISSDYESEYSDESDEENDEDEWEYYYP